MTTAIGSTPLRPPRRTAVGAHVPALLEWFAVFAAIALLWPAFERIADGAGGRDRRFAETAFAIEGLPDEVLPGACAAFGAFADVSVQERLCGRSAGRVAGTLSMRLPLELMRASAQAARAIAAPMHAAEARREALHQRQRDGSDDVREMADGMAAIEAESQPFAERYRLVEPTRVSGPVPLACATRWLESALTVPLPEARSPDHETSARRMADMASPRVRSVSDRVIVPHGVDGCGRWQWCAVRKSGVRSGP